MAFPRDRFGAHDGGPLRRGEGDETFDGRPEFRRGHVIRIAAESRAPPSRVHAVRRGFAEAAKSLEVLVPDAALAQRGSQGGLLGPGRTWRSGAHPPGTRSGSLGEARGTRRTNASSGRRSRWYDHPRRRDSKTSKPSRRRVVACEVGSRTLRRRVGPDDRVDEERVREGRGERLGGAEIC